MKTLAAKFTLRPGLALHVGVFTLKAFVFVSSGKNKVRTFYGTSAVVVATTS